MVNLLDTRLIRPIRFGPAVEVWEARLRGRRVLARRFAPEGPPPGWPPPPDPHVLRSMNHPSLQRFCGEYRAEDGSRVQVFSWRRGETLANRLRRGSRIPPGACRTIVHSAAAGLRWLHERGPASPVLHGDVSPGNLLVTPVRCVWLDLLALPPGRWPAGPGIVFGTLCYVAPEVLAGQPPREASEVFSLGMMAVEALTGLIPWKDARSPSEVLARIERDPPARWVPDIPEWPSSAIAALRALLSPDPAVRPTAGDVVAAFRSRY